MGYLLIEVIHYDYQTVLQHALENRDLVLGDNKTNICCAQEEISKVVSEISAIENQELDSDKGISNCTHRILLEDAYNALHSLNVAPTALRTGVKKKVKKYHGKFPLYLLSETWTANNLVKTERNPLN